MKTAVWVVLGVVVLGGGAWVLHGKLAKPAQAAGRTVTASLGTIEQTVDATGYVSPLNRVEIKPPISGRIEKLLVDEGEAVRTGQILAWMSSSDRAAILDAARAQGPAELKKWEDAYKATPIVAPLSGVIILRNVVVGQTVDPSIVLYAMSDRLIVLAQVDESDIGRVKVGMPARITLDAYPNHVDEGTVFDVLYEGKNVSNVIQYGVKINLAKVPPFYRSEMTANISFIAQRKENVVTLPLTAVKDSPDGKKLVMIPGADGKPQPREVALGLSNDENVEVVSGLTNGEKVWIAQSKYVKQQGPQGSPLTGGPRPQQSNQNAARRG